MLHYSTELNCDLTYCYHTYSNADSSGVLTVLALKVEQLLLHTCQLGLQSLYSGPVVILELPQLLPVGLTLSLNPGRQICLSLRQICLQSNIF